MLNDKYLKIPIWTWIIIGVVVLYSVYNISCKNKENKITNETKEQYEYVDKTFSNIVIYNFNTSWCGWSKKFQPEWDKFSKHVNKLDNIKALDIKCDNDVNNIKLASKYNVPGYPYIIIIIDNKEPIVYNGKRTSNDLIEYIQIITKK